MTTRIAGLIVFVAVFFYAAGIVTMDYIDMQLSCQEKR